MYFAMQAVMVEIKILYFGRVFPINGEGSAFLIETTAIHSDSQRNQAAATASLPLRATWKRNREVAMTTIVSNRRASFGMNCVQCANELIAPNGPSIRMSGTSFIFGAAGDAAAVSSLWSFFLPTQSR